MAQDATLNSKLRAMFIAHGGGNNVLPPSNCPDELEWWLGQLVQKIREGKDGAAPEMRMKYDNLQLKYPSKEAWGAESTFPTSLVSEMAKELVGRMGSLKAWVESLPPPEIPAMPEIPPPRISLTHAELTTKISNSTLVPGQKYLISDFMTIYKQPVTNTIIYGVTTAGAIGTSSNTNYEPLVVTALSNNKLEPIAFSPSNPYDVIYYDVTKNNTSRFEWAVSSDKGQIYRRITKNNNDIPYDVRTIRFKRYQVNASAINAWVSSTSYNKGSIVKNSNSVYVAIKPNTNITPNSSYGIWQVLCSVTGNYSYLGLSTSGLSVYVNTNQPSVPVNSSSPKDFYTFDDGDEKSQIDSIIVFNNVIDPYITSTKQTLNNSAFIKGNFNDNTISSNFYNNTINSSFRCNTIRDFFCHNITNDSFINNNIGRYFQYNIVDVNFCYNSIDTSFTNNVIGANFKKNIIGIDFIYNAVGENFEFNTISTLFSYNNISTLFSSNSIGTEFSNNNINSNFTYNNICSNFTTNTINANFSKNNIDDSFTSNTIDNYFRHNVIGNIFGGNTIGEYFQANIVETQFGFNQIGNYFNYNRFGSYFRWNKLLNYNTTLSDVFQYNEFGNGIQFSSLKDWGTAGEAQFKSYNTVQVWKNATGGISIAYIASNTAVVPTVAHILT